LNNHLIPKDLSKRPDHLELCRKGGRAKSPARAFQSRINGLMTSKKLTDEQKYMLALLKDKAFTDLIIELISMNVEEGVNKPARRDKIIDQLSKFLPAKNINFEVDMSNTRIKELKSYLEGRDESRKN